VNQQVLLSCETNELIFKDRVEICTLRLKFYNESFTTLFEQSRVYGGLSASGCIDFAHVFHEQSEVVTQLLLAGTIADRIYARYDACLKIAGQLSETL